MAFASVAAETWLYGHLLTRDPVVETFADRVFAEEAGGAGAEDGPYLAFTRVVAIESGAIGAETSSWQFGYDIVGWTLGTTTDPILAAMNDIDAALQNGTSAVTGDGYLITVENLGAEVPPAPPARSGEPPAKRLGRTYTLFLSRA